MEPVPESRQALEKLIDTGEERFAAEVLRLGRGAREIVPECVGLSLAIMHHGLTFTLAATDEDIAGLDAVQYLDGGPCVRAAHEHARVEVEEDELFDEAQWQLYAQSSAAAGVRSSLTLPILDESGTVISTVNLYASTPDAFEGRVDLLAEALGATAAKAVANADLSFNTRLDAAAGPERLDEAMDVNIALSVIAENQNVDMATARERLRVRPHERVSTKHKPHERSSDYEDGRISRCAVTRRRRRGVGSRRRLRGGRVGSALETLRVLGGFVVGVGVVGGFRGRADNVGGYCDDALPRRFGACLKLVERLLACDPVSRHQHSSCLMDQSPPASNAAGH